MPVRQLAVSFEAGATFIEPERQWRQRTYPTNSCYQKPIARRNGRERAIAFSLTIGRDKGSTVERSIVLSTWPRFRREIDASASGNVRLCYACAKIHT